MAGFSAFLSLPPTVLHLDGAGGPLKRLPSRYPCI